MSLWDLLQEKQEKREEDLQRVAGDATADVVEPAQEADHKHEWQFITKTYGAPRKDMTKIEGDATQKALFGITTLLWECMICKALRKQELLGSEGSQLDDLLIKANDFGPQYIQREGITFAIAKLQQPAQTPGIPVR